LRDTAPESPVTDIFKLKDFKPLPVVFMTVPGGYVYRAPNARLFGFRNQYLVNEAQKAEILAIFKTPTQLILPIWRRAKRLLLQPPPGQFHRLCEERSKYAASWVCLSDLAQ
jgi:hypothetical protein